MREIKFRAWDKSTKSMINDGDSWRMYILNGCVSSINDIWATKDLQLMQFTGLKDCNGVEIYEGDVIKPFVGGEEFIYEIRFDVSTFNNGWNINPKIIEDGAEIIGNIYENPELVES